MLNRSMLWHASAAAAILLSSAFSVQAQAATDPLSAAQVLQQFNLVVLGDSTSTSHVDGRSWIGGNLTGGDYVQHAGDTAASNYAGLTVMGTASNLHVNGLGAVAGNMSNSIVNSGDSYVSGSVSGSIFNGLTYVGGASSSTYYNNGLLTTPSGVPASSYQAAGSTNFGSVLSGLSTTLAGMSNTSSVSINGNRTTFNAVAGASGVAVFNLDNALSQQIFSTGEFTFATNGASTIIINSSVTAASIAANFLEGQAPALGSSIIWNFYNATSIAIGAQFGGSILATQASLTNNQNIEGGVYVNSLTQNAEIHLQAFSGNIAAVPEPQVYASMLAGLAVVGMMATRRRKKAAQACNAVQLG